MLGERGKPAERVGFQAAQKLISELSSGCACDSLLADQLIPLLALFGGEVRAERISEHLKSNVIVAEAFLGRRFEIDEKEEIVRAL